ncbi:16S rRNA (adenine(1518)-N(6)/adenine(1519)-N(6))-dimethyltransferase RsmA [Thiohalobacter sp.]|uniref:16S rRNA (adenine(1518)-N(6)/adenine(1519)-N(6))- dimethyltransferase RsmA n=1 Tax=Thiohalobacter sp. TaxID=2025948 RepID=UPI00262D4A0A|nr:16S rRNA (adenine(1518)-N(6)/adenine(1519)-N(6))-dimethyltransferase RsmA [Thiohalobacter sp.]
MKHRPRKRFGQNFLHDARIIERIVAAIDPQPGDHLVEIGPGQGALTFPLLERAGELDVIELDRDLAAWLRAQDTGGRPLRVHEQDALKTAFCALAEPPLRVVGNLPYNISTPLLFHLIGQSHCIRDMHFMLQKEVVTRMAAAPGSGDYGRLSVMVQWHCRVEPLFLVRPGAFNPPPKVDSAVVRLVPHARPPVELADPALFEQVVKAAFAQRRKTLRNSLRGLVETGAFEEAGIDPGARAETLSLAQFATLANAASRPSP